MLIRAPVGTDRAEWLRMRRALWPTSDDDEHTREVSGFLESAVAPVAVFVADREAGGSLGGFLEMGLRSYAEGCRSSPVPYIEGWYVDPDLRRRGVGEALVEAAEAWARERGHTEIASDTAPDNEVSLAAHERLGFSVTDRMVCFRKELGAGQGHYPGCARRRPVP
ncbi:MAG TPA: aminoglycoside 6'-N-acetyltransferase [Longimicrobiales bacterium]|nr:aminoglycoside 6'-N-acetyltransferase [Longimicrobiales bacterium]